MDETRFEHLSGYLAALPAGLASYPDCQSKGTIMRSVLHGRAFHASWSSLPRELVDVLERPPLPTQWVPTVITDAVFHVLCDTFHPTADAMLKATYDRTIRVANSPTYRVLTRLAGLKNFLRGAVKIHSLFQKGTDLSLELDDHEARIVLSHPPYLHLGLNHLSNEAAFRAALVAAGAKEASVTMTASKPTFAHYVARWTE